MNVVMNHQLKKIRDFAGTRAGKAAAASFGLASVLYAVAANAPIVKVGANSTTYTYTDIHAVHSFNGELAELGPKGKKGAGSFNAVFQALMLAGIEKEILDARKIPQGDKDRITQDIINASPYGGLLDQEKKRLGEERFYKLFVQPVVVDRIFGEYYLAKENGREKAEKALRAAQSEGISAVATKIGVKVQRVTIPVMKETAQLVELAKASVGVVLPKFVEEPVGYAVMHVVDVNESQVVADAMMIPRQGIGEFIKQELKAANVPVKDYFYSWFRVAALEKEGGILAATVAKKDQKEGE